MEKEIIIINGREYEVGNENNRYFYAIRVGYFKCPMNWERFSIKILREYRNNKLNESLLWRHT